MERTLFLIAAGLSLVPMAGTALALFEPSALVSLYPLLLLPFFRSQSHGKAAWFLPGAALISAGMLFDRLSLYWIGSYWNFLAVCAYAGRGFAFPAPFLVFSAPPLSAFTSVAFGFWLRLRLTEAAAGILSILDPQTSASGNVITFGDTAFAVDRLCEGTKMAAATALLAVVFFRQSARPARIFIALTAFPLWSLSNVLRIVVLVAFKIPPESSAHELLGALFFISMVVFPLSAARVLFPAVPAPVSAPLASPRQPQHAARLRLLAPAALCCVLAAGWLFAAPSRETRRWPERILDLSLDPESIRSDPRIAVYSRADGTSLILKTDLFAPGTAHDPRICFEAAGFSFLAETEEKLGSVHLRSARVTKAGKPARLYWWYAWDRERSSSDLSWRAARARGREVYQWNLYGEDSEALRNLASSLLLLDQGRAINAGHPE